jgi:ketosteroid isomerase-like protein
MSREIELLRGRYDEWTRKGTLAADWLAPDFDFWQGPGEELTGGRDELLRAIADFQDFFDEWHFRPQEFIDKGEHVLVIGRMGGRAKTSGVVVDQPIAHEWKMREGVAIRLCAYPNTPEGRQRRRDQGPA